MHKSITDARGTASTKIQPAESFSSLRALAIIASRLGLDVSVEQLHRRFALPPGEPDTATLVSLAKEIGLEARSLHMTFQELPQIGRALPAILRARDGGALILEEARTDPAKGTVAVIRDPSSTDDVVIAIDELHLAEVWEGEAILVKRRHTLNNEQQLFDARWLFGQVLRERKLLHGILLSALAGSIFAIAPSFVMRVIVDRVLVNQSWQTLNIVVAAVVLLLLFETVVVFFRRFLTEVVMTRIDGRMNLYILEKLLKLPMDFFENNPSGRTVTQLHHAQNIRIFLEGRFFNSIPEIVPLVLLVPVMVIIEWHMALMAFALGGVVFVIVLAYLKPMHNLFVKVVAAENAKGSHLNETLHGIKTVKSLSLEGRRRREWDYLVANVISARYDWAALSNYPDTFALPFHRLIQTGCMALGAYLYLYDLGTPNAGSITPGTLMAFYLLSGQLAKPLINIAALQRDLAEVRGSVNAVGNVVNNTPEDTRSEGLRQSVKGEVSFQDVRFRYSNDAPFALAGVSFTVPPGTMLGIMGRSGSGKTTITRLLQCLNTAYDGMIKIDGIDLREINLLHLRTHIGVVPQENFLFSGTLRENISMAKPDATFAEVVRAAQLSGAEEFIERLPRGYDTPIREGGNNLSGGQRQRLALARALLIDPPILILDEATSALDAESEAIVNANLRRMAKGRTVLSISHRLSMLVECDAILVLEKGMVYDFGTHDELMQRCDIYKHMWYEQNRHSGPGSKDQAQVLLEGRR